MITEWEIDCKNVSNYFLSCAHIPCSTSLYLPPKEVVYSVTLEFRPAFGLL